MMNDRGVILWDFDGTLAHRNGFFSEVLLQVLDDNEPQHSVRVDDIRPFLRDGFPWHFPENPHFDLTDPVAWWAFVERSFVRAFEGLGLPKEKAAEYSRQSHTRYIDPDGFDLYSDTEETLQSFLNMGWRHAILSNHVPELPAIGRELGLDRYVCECI